MTSEQVTSPPWSSRRLVHSKEMVWASRWSVALRTFSIGKFFLCYIAFFFWNFRPRLARKLFAYYLIGTNIYIIWYLIFYFLFIQYNVWIASCRTRPQCCFSRAPNPFEGDSDPKNPYICGTCDLHSEKLLFFWSRVFVNLEVLHDASSMCRY